MEKSDVWVAIAVRWSLPDPLSLSLALLLISILLSIIN
jgi:hypothetical protein